MPNGCYGLVCLLNEPLEPFLLSHVLIPFYELGLLYEGGVRVCGDAVLCYFWCGFAVIFILTCGIAVSKH